MPVSRSQRVGIGTVLAVLGLQAPWAGDTRCRLDKQRRRTLLQSWTVWTQSLTCHEDSPSRPRRENTLRSWSESQRYSTRRRVRQLGRVQGPLLSQLLASPGVPAALQRRRLSSYPARQRSRQRTADCPPYLLPALERPSQFAEPPLLSAVDQCGLVLPGDPPSLLSHFALPFGSVEAHAEAGWYKPSKGPKVPTWTATPCPLQSA